MRGDGPIGSGPFPRDEDEAGRAYCDGEAEVALCNDAMTLEAFRAAVDAAITPDYGNGPLVPLNRFEVGAAYGEPARLDDLAAESAELEETFEVQEVALSTALLFDDELDPQIQALYRLDRCRAEGPLQQMAEAGGGTFVSFDAPDAIDLSALEVERLPGTTCPAVE